MLTIKRLTTEEREELLANMDRLLELYSALDSALNAKDLLAVAGMKSEAETLQLRNAQIKAWRARGSA